ncbi:hypothetical protein ABIC37_005107 [Priestia megaterium]|uniref:hypothetical protein n=1 Tax=Priestia megaterium TaxID=1404 RepID=UPI0033962667
MADWTTAVTIMGSFGAASTAQIISHVLTNNREKKKHDKECLQNLYSPVIFRIVDYLEVEYKKSETHIRLKGMEIDVLISNSYHKERRQRYEEYILEASSIFKVVIESISKNLKYAHSSLILAYEDHEALSASFKENEINNFQVFSKKIKICRELLIEFVRISNKLDALSKPMLEKVQGALFFTEFYLLLLDCNYEILAEKIIKYYEGLSKIPLNESNYLDRIAYIRKEISLVPIGTTAYINKEATAYTHAYQFFHEVVDEMCENRQLFWVPARFEEVRKELNYTGTDKLKHYEYRRKYYEMGIYDIYRRWE